jgi:hypothetical protein
MNETLLAGGVPNPGAADGSGSFMNNAGQVQRRLLDWLLASG